MWKLWTGSCVPCPCPVLPRAKGYRRHMDRLSPRWTFAQKFSLDEIKNGHGGGHKTPADRKSGSEDLRDGLICGILICMQLSRISHHCCGITGAVPWVVDPASTVTEF